MLNTIQAQSTITRPQPAFKGKIYSDNNSTLCNTNYLQDRTLAQQTIKLGDTILYAFWHKSPEFKVTTEYNKPISDPAFDTLTLRDATKNDAPIVSIEFHSPKSLGRTVKVKQFDPETGKMTSKYEFATTHLSEEDKEKIENIVEGMKVVNNPESVDHTNTLKKSLEKIIDNLLSNLS